MTEPFVGTYCSICDSEDCHCGLYSGIGNASGTVTEALLERPEKPHLQHPPPVVGEVEAMRQLEDAGVVEPDSPASGSLRPEIMDSIGDLLDDVQRFYLRFVIFPSAHAPVALALWTLHTHVIEAADCTPYVHISSAAPTSGKTRVSEVAELLVHAPLRTSGTSPAAVFREIDRDRPTLILDEIDTQFGNKGSDDRAEDLRGLLNGGFNRGAYYLRCEGRDFKTKRFDVFAPKLLAGLGDVPDTVAKRSIPIRLQRRARHEHVDRFRRRQVEPEARALRGRIEVWAAENLAILREAAPVLPDELTDRQQDAWEPLLAIADVAGREWAEKARAAARAIHDVTDDESTLGVVLLDHIWEAFGTEDRITTDSLLHALIERDDAPWASWWARDVEDGKTKGPASRLARLLRPFGVKSKKLRIDDKTAQGYEIRSFKEPFLRYLPEKSEQRNTAGQRVVSNGSDELKQAPDQACSDVPSFPQGVKGTPGNAENGVTRSDTRTESLKAGPDEATRTAEAVDLIKRELGAEVVDDPVDLERLDLARQARFVHAWNERLKVKEQGASEPELSPAERMYRRHQERSERAVRKP